MSKMNLRNSIVTILVAILLCSLSGLASGSPRHVAGSDVSKRVDLVMKNIQWQDSLEKLKETAQKKKKLIFWLQIVGELDGGL